MGQPTRCKELYKGAAATVIIGKLSKNLLMTIVGGMACFALWHWLMRSL